jgi:hypothetical protein
LTDIMSKYQMNTVVKSTRVRRNDDEKSDEAGFKT